MELINAGALKPFSVEAGAHQGFFFEGLN